MKLSDDISKIILEKRVKPIELTHENIMDMIKNLHPPGAVILFKNKSLTEFDGPYLAAGLRYMVEVFYQNERQTHVYHIDYLLYRNGIE